MFKELAKRLGFLPPQDARGKQDPAVESPEAPAPQDAGEPETSLELEPLAGIEELDPAALFAEEGPRPEEDASASPRNAQAEFEVGVQLCQMKEYLMGLEALTRAAEQGHAQAQFLCGCMYRQGVGVEVDERQALTWLRRSGKQGVLEAQLACAEIYETGNGAKLNLKQALYWYEQAAKQGSLAAQLKCGNMYSRGRAENRNPKKARRWLEAAAQQGSEEARDLLERYF